MPKRFAIADLPSTPWKNGGGSTREVVCQPPSAGMDAFDWRVSIATIARSGPFSVFAGMDRTILLLGGDGVHLSAAGHWEHALATPGEPFAFSGDLAVDCRMLGGESTDFNVMTRRGVVTADVQVHREAFALAASTGGVVLALEGHWALQTEGAALDMGEGQGVWWADSASAWWGFASSPQARLLTVRISPVVG